MNYYVIFRFNKKDFVKSYLQKNDKFPAKGDGFLTAKKFFDESSANAKIAILRSKDKNSLFLITGVEFA
jgi:hypothetical protein